jgi:hypothetical protein
MDVNELSQRLTMRWIDMCAPRGRHPRTPSAAELTTIQVLLQAIISSPTAGRGTPGTNLQGPPQLNQLIQTIQNLDRQMDVYEKPDLLVRESNMKIITARARVYHDS